MSRSSGRSAAIASGEREPGTALADGGFQRRPQVGGEFGNALNGRGVTGCVLLCPPALGGCVCGHAARFVVRNPAVRRAC